MNASLWQLAGWTMIHSLWLGAAVALAGGFLRLAARRAAPNTRYAISLTTLALLAATPIAAAAWLSVNGMPQLAAIGAHEINLLPLPLGDGTKRARSPVETERSAVARAQHWGEGQSQVHALNPHSLQAATPNAQNQPAPGRMPGISGPVIDLAQATPAELDALAAQQQSPQAPPTNAQPPLPPTAILFPSTSHQSPIIDHPSPTYSPTHLLTYSPTHLLTYSLRYLPTLWLIGAPLTFTLLATGLVGSERLRRRATPLHSGTAYEACQRLRQTLNITRRVALAVCDDVAQPILVGIVRPLILLPTAALAGWTPEQLDMVLLHELAHVRRWDNLVNLLQRIVESLLFFHPAVWLVSRQVRRDREECCDAAVIRHTDQPHQYAELLVSIAAALRGGPAPSLAVASAMASHPLAGRIRRILNIEAEPMCITRRTLAATLLLPLLLAGAIFYSGASAEDTPSVKKQSSEVDAGDDAESASLNNAEKPSKASARAKLIDDKLEEGAASVRTVYPIPPGTLVDPIELAKAIQSRHPVEIAWAEHQQGIIVSAPQDVHERVAALIKKSAAKTAKFTDDTFKPIMAHNLVDGDNAPLVGGYGILEEFAAEADPSRIDAAIERLKAEKRSFSVEQSDNGSKRIVDQTPPPKKSTAKKPPIIQDDSSPYKQLQDLFTATDANPAVTVKYQAPPGVRKYVEDMFDGMEKDPYGPQISFHRVWSDDERTVEITAPTMAQGLYLDTVFNALSLESNVRRLENARNSKSTATPSDEDDASAVAKDAPLQLHKEIRNATDLIAKAQKEIIDSEVAKQLAILNSGTPATVETAVNAELEKDSTIGMYKSQLLELNSQLQAKLSTSKNPGDANIKRLRSVIQQTEAQAAQYRSEAERVIRDKLARTANDMLSAEIAELKLRRMGAEVELAEYQQRLLYYKQKLAEANAQLGVPQAIGTYATPMIAAAGAFEKHVKHEGQIAGVPGSPNHGAAATGSNANNAGPTANTSPDSAAPAQNTTTSPYSHPGVEFTQLQNEIRNLEDLIVKAQKDLIDLEVFKERSVRNLNIPPTIDATTVMELDNNPAIQQQKKQLLDLTSTLQTKLSVSENPDDADIKRLRASMQEAEAELAKRRSEAASTFREKIAKMNKEVLRSAMTEYKIRRKSWEDNLAKHQQELAAAKTKLAQLKGEAASDSPNQIAAATGNTAGDTTAIDLKHRQKKTVKFILNAEAAANIKSQLAANAEWLGLENYEWAGDDSWVNVTGDDDKLKAFAEYVDKFDPFRTTTDDVARSVVDEPQPGVLDPFDSAARRTEVPSLSPFPTLENQKIADRAYKLLGLELEPLTPEELERVKKLGYNGGLRVVAVDPLKQKHLALFPDVLLVGLHVWPTTDLQSLDAILTREDLGDLAPLKYRAIANVPTEETRRSDNPVMEDRLITGRMPIDLEAFRSIRQSLTSNHANAAKIPPSEAKPASDFDAITVIQAPTSQKTSIFGGTVTTAYLRVKLNRLPYSVDAPNGRLSPQEIERNSMNCLAIVTSSSVLQTALNAVQKSDEGTEGVEALQMRLSASFPGDGEILELKLEGLEGGDAKKDAALLQAVIDAFIAAVKAPPESPADPNAAATVLPGDLSSSTRPEVDAASAAAEYPKAFAAALEQSRKQGKPVVVHFLAHNSEPSQRFVDEILANEQVVKFIDEHFIPVTIYADDEPAFAEAFQISRVPVDMFVFAGGDCTYGGITTPATPADYLAHLKTYHKLATTPEGQYPTPNPYIPEVAPAPVADRPANDQKPAATVDAGDAVSLKVAGAFPEAPLDGVFTIEPAGTLPLGPLYGRVVVAGKTVLEAEAAVKEHLSRTLTDVAVQLTLGPNPATTAEAPTPAAGSSPTFLYDGKTFEEWRDLWKLELNPERRIEAINALAAFGRAGYGQEAAKEILDVAAQYRNDGTSSDLLSAINLAIGRMPADHWMPQVLQRLQSSDGPQRDVWRQHAKNYLQSSRDFGPEARALAAKFANDPADGLLNVTANYLLRYDQKLEDQLTIDLVRKALSEDANHGETLQYLGFRNLDKVPEQLDLLVRDQRARGELHQLMQQQFMQRGVDGYGAPELVAPMLAILNAPNRADDHVGAIRTLKAMSPALRRRGMEAERLQVVEQLTTILRDGPDELLLPAWAALSHLSETAAENIPREYVNEGKISAEQGKRLREFDQQELIDEANAD